jgi:hypothetical protein
MLHACSYQGFRTPAADTADTEKDDFGLLQPLESRFANGLYGSLKVIHDA